MMEPRSYYRNYEKTHCRFKCTNIYISIQQVQVITLIKDAKLNKVLKLDILQATRVLAKRADEETTLMQKHHPVSELKYEHSQNSFL